jgi:hypothetical protein
VPPPQDTAPTWRPATPLVACGKPAGCPIAAQATRLRRRSTPHGRAHTADTCINTADGQLLCALCRRCTLWSWTWRPAWRRWAPTSATPTTASTCSARPSGGWAAWGRRPRAVEGRPPWLAVGDRFVLLHLLPLPPPTHSTTITTECMLTHAHSPPRPHSTLVPGLRSAVPPFPLAAS